MKNPHERPRGEGGKFLKETVLSRKFCSGCGRWRHLVDFGPLKWNEDGSAPKRVQARCGACRRKQMNEYYHQMRPAQKKQRNQASRTWHRRDRRRRGLPEIGARAVTNKKGDSVRREPFGRWLKEKVDERNRHCLVTRKAEDGPSYVAGRTGLGEKQIWFYINGYDSGGGHNEASRKKGGKKRKLRPIDWVSFDLVDKALFAWGEPHVLAELYPIEPEPEEEPLSPPPRAAVDDEFNELVAAAPKIGSSKDVPDIIGEYQRRRRARKPR